MARNKLIRFQENSQDSLILQPGNPEYESVKKNWQSFFGNNNPLILELACGKGEYTVWLAPHFIDKNFVWVDVKWNRLRYGTQQAKELWLRNVGFVRWIIQNIHEFFIPKSIEEIRIVHPDPKPRGKDAHRRLTHPRFLAMYQELLIPWWLIKLKTDDADFFTYSLESLGKEWREIIGKTDDLYNDPLLWDHYGIKTYYEEMFHKKGRTIHYCKARKCM